MPGSSEFHTAQWLLNVVPINSNIALSQSAAACSRGSQMRQREKEKFIDNQND